MDISKAFHNKFELFLFSRAAKDCDEIGRIAAVLAVTGDWDSDIARDVMRIKWRENTQ